MIIGQLNPISKRKWTPTEQTSPATVYSIISTDSSTEATIVNPLTISGYLGDAFTGPQDFILGASKQGVSIVSDMESIAPTTGVLYHVFTSDVGGGPTDLAGIVLSPTALGVYTVTVGGADFTDYTGVVITPTDTVTVAVDNTGANGLTTYAYLNGTLIGSHVATAPLTNPLVQFVTLISCVAPAVTVTVDNDYVVTGVINYSTTGGTGNWDEVPPIDGANTAFEVEGLAAPLSTPKGAIDNGNVAYFNYANELNFIGGQTLPDTVISVTSSDTVIVVDNTDPQNPSLSIKADGPDTSFLGEDGTYHDIFNDLQIVDANWLFSAGTAPTYTSAYVNVDFSNHPDVIANSGTINPAALISTWQNSYTSLGYQVTVNGTTYTSLTVPALTSINLVASNTTTWQQLLDQLNASLTNINVTATFSGANIRLTVDTANETDSIDTDNFGANYLWSWGYATVDTPVAPTIDDPESPSFTTAHRIDGPGMYSQDAVRITSDTSITLDNTPTIVIDADTSLDASAPTVTVTGSTSINLSTPDLNWDGDTIDTIAYYGVRGSAPSASTLSKGTRAYFTDKPNSYGGHFVVRETNNPLVNIWDRLSGGPIDEDTYANLRANYNDDYIGCIAIATDVGTAPTEVIKVDGKWKVKNGAATIFVNANTWMLPPTALIGTGTADHIVFSASVIGYASSESYIMTYLTENLTTLPPTPAGWYPIVYTNATTGTIYTDTTLTTPINYTLGGTITGTSTATAISTDMITLPGYLFYDYAQIRMRIRTRHTASTNDKYVTMLHSDVALNTINKYTSRTNATGALGCTMDVDLQALSGTLVMGGNQSAVNTTYGVGNFTLSVPNSTAVNNATENYLTIYLEKQSASEFLYIQFVRAEILQ